ncbi:MAG: gliding motility-associated C-terminal domain-containing protein, partial [Bacteroidia bacterium]
YTTTLTAAGATTYSWSPGALTGATVVSTPTASTVYTLTAANGACQVTQTLQVNTISSPTVTAGNSGPITCTLSSVNLTGTFAGSNLAFIWTGPGSFTSSVLSPTNIMVPGTYTFAVKDTISGCISSATTAIIASTIVPITATIVPSTCTGTVSNNNGTILVSGFVSTDEFDFVAGSTYTGTATYATAAPVPTTGVVTNTLTNPLLPTSYTIRFFGINGCFKDTTLILQPNNCVPNPDFGLAKAVGTPSLQTNGSYNVTYTVVAVNSSTNTLSNVVLTESLTATFPAPSTYSVVSPPVVVNAGSSLTINSTFDGNVNSSITTATSSTMPPSHKDTIVFTVNIIPNGFFGPFNNSVLGAVASGTNTLFDISTSGLNADPDADNNFGNNSLPTVLNLQPSLFFGLTKEGTLSDKLDDGSYDITYTIKVHNLGNDTLRNVTVKDSITLTSPAQFTIKSGPVTTGSLTADASYSGSSNINLLIPATSKIAPGTVNSIMFTINVKPDTVTVIKNSAFGSATHGTVVVADTSNAGSNPDTNNNGVWNEAVDNVPTVLIISDSQLFIPEGFSPNGDGKNDLFVIRGLKNVENTITVYNRWGNKVYSKNNYDNTWDGAPNAAGTLGNQKLPQGTYYYVLEFKNSDMKPVYGYVILQY